MRRRYLGIVITLAAVVAGFWVAGPARSQPRPGRRPLPLPAAIAATTGVPLGDVTKVLNALGPEIQRRLAGGEQVALPGVGVFRVVQIPQHRALVNGRPGMVASENYVEFLPDQRLVQASNQPGARPAAVIPQFQYNPLPDQFKSPKVGRVRVPSTRSR